MLDPTVTLWLLLAVIIAAALYSSVGHGGASGYLAAMALFGLAPAVMKPAVLTMNIAVTVLVLWRLYPRGYFDWRLFTPLIIASIPLAFVGGALRLDDATYKVVVGVMLLLAMWRFFFPPADAERRITRPGVGLSLVVGGVLGFLSGITGVGGGIYLSPLLLLFRWTTMRGSAAIAAGFVLVNSAAGLAGFATTAQAWPGGVPVLVVCAILGGLIGSELCAQRVAPHQLRKLLGLVLLIAGAKMIAAA